MGERKINEIIYYLLRIYNPNVWGRLVSRIIMSMGVQKEKNLYIVGGLMGEDINDSQQSFWALKVCRDGVGVTSGKKD